MQKYLEQLTIRLATAISALPESIRQRHANFIIAAQRDDGGFAGREGDSDLYYTAFAMRSLAMLGELDGDVAQRCNTYLRNQLGSKTSIVDFFSLIYAANLLDLAAGIDIFDTVAQHDEAGKWKTKITEMFESFRQADGGYAKGPEGKLSSTYHTFLVALCYQLLECPFVEPQKMIDFVFNQQRDDGGFVDILPMKRSGTNPTAAAVGLLKIVEVDEPAVFDDVAEFLAEMQTDEGGIRANTRIPIADLLSSFTGLLTLTDLGYLKKIDTNAIMQYALSLQNEEGGFLAAAWDEQVDLEYTFYGLATIGLLAYECEIEIVE